MIRPRKAQSGVGTLIMFIAMITVAAITANVLVQTATSLQNQALLTGKRAQQSISTIAQTIGVIGMNGSDGSVEDFRVELKLAPGSDGIDLSKAMLSMDTGGNGYTYTYSNKSCINDSSTGYSTDPTEKNGTFTVKYLIKGSNHIDGYLQRGDIIKLCFASTESIKEDQDVEIRFIPSIGLTTTMSFSTTNVMNSYRVKLYP
ncbi:MAG: archaellin/type IV pilin N-terminal domain-containing protein [Nanoarchaeota archaeon]